MRVRVSIAATSVLLGAALVSAPTLATGKGGPGASQSAVIPANAVEVAPNVFSLGKAKDIDGRVVEGFAIVHPKRQNHHKPGHSGGPGGNGGNGGGDSGPKCFAFLAKDAKWKSVEPYVLNPANQAGLANQGGDLLNKFEEGVGAWESAASVDILGAGSSTTDLLVADGDAPDDVNEVYFGDIEEANVIAVTITWGIFGGPPANRELVEWDMVFDDADFGWAHDGALDKMDFRNIATHETGHAVGLGHPGDSCTEETMYRFASVGEIEKRDLNAGDITGVQTLY